VDIHEVGAKTPKSPAPATEERLFGLHRCHLYLLTHSSPQSRPDVRQPETPEAFPWLFLSLA
jgi:hypothetical protein